MDRLKVFFVIIGVSLIPLVMLLILFSSHQWPLLLLFLCFSIILGLVFLLPSHVTPLQWLTLESELKKFRMEFLRENAQVRALMKGVPDPIFITDEHLKPLFINSSFKRFFHVPKGQKNIESIDDYFDAEEVKSELQKTITSAKSRQFTIALTPKVQNEPTYHFSVSLSPIRIKSENSIFGAAAIFHDVTEIKNTEMIRTEFVANASHELRTPLTVITGYTHTLLDDLKTHNITSAYSCAEVIEKTSKRLMNLVQDLLDISTLESQKGIQKKWHSTQSLTQGPMDQIQAKASEKNQKVNLKFEAEQVFCDGKRAEQVMINLIENAIKYSNEGDHIDVEWSENSRQTFLKVQDHGPGIAKLFERFYRVDQHRSREKGGTGLGLAIAKHILQRHGGKIEVESDAGEGTVFLCSFPKN